MEILSSGIQMRAAHTSFSATRVTEQLEFWSGNPAGPGLPGLNSGSANRTQVTITPQAKDAAAADEILPADDDDGLDPQLRLMATMIEIITGRPLKLLRMAALRDPQQATADIPALQGNAAQAQATQGPGFEYSLSATRVEYEFTQFQAEGIIRSKDGREITFKVGFEMERLFAETLNIEIRGGQARLKDPLVLDFGGPGAALRDARFAFDLTADGNTEQLPMLGGGRGFLAIDRNGNGRIDDGRELFGPTSGDGFAELAALDADRNGWIDAADPAFEKLRLWMPDINGNGSLLTMAEAGIGALYLKNLATPFELRNQTNETLGVMRASSIYVADNGRVGTVSQIDLAV